ncbi:MAG: aminotransferase class V-fold PLP-dependent enzyme [Planctomycetota bacterium]|nr:MAG: aminotransferase class V-fold PLP-dependent enzyme [Planctomycetota bacterium]REK44689.1 MAG: aminotransferase class V-fold PLP-dependent enzyme [Planctomycetota bacterium]
MSYEPLPEIYLDANATTKCLPQAAAAAQQAMEHLFGNPSSSHITGIRARQILESGRQLARAVLGADSGRIIFTSGATEAIQMGVLSALCHVRQQRRVGDDAARDRLLLYGATEHKAVPQALEHWNELLGLGDQVMAIPVDDRGRLDLEFLRAHAAEADMVCTMAVNNETGVIHDLARVEEVLRAANPDVPWMVDSVQAVGKLALNLSQTTIDYAPASGHKVYAPKGIGLLYVREGAPITPLIAGGGQEEGARSGTENLPGVAAFAAVLERLVDEQDDIFAPRARLIEYRDRLRASLSTAFPTIVFNTPFEDAVPTTINFSVQGFTSKEILDLFDAAGIRVSSGSACGSALRGSYVLDAMGMPKWRSEGAIRVSFGRMTSEDEVASACRRIEEAGQALRESCLIVPETGPSAAGPERDGLVQLKRGSMCSWIYVDAAARNCIVVDPFEELEDRIVSLVRCQNLRVLAILDTHHHVDHDSCRLRLLERLAEQLAPQALAADSLGWPTVAEGPLTLADGTPAMYFPLSDREILVRTELGGHTVDSQAYLVAPLPVGDRIECEEVRFAFTGDTLQIGGIGRSDFPSSSVEALYDSLRRLPRIVGQHSVLCPTHDYCNGFVTTFGSELANNALLAAVLDAVAPISREAFVEEKVRVDEQIDDDANCELICGLIQPRGKSSSSVDVRPEELRDFFFQHRESRIIDVREPHEFQFAQDWEGLGLAEPPTNVPLTQFGNFLQSLLAGRETSRDSDRDIVFVCRSGNRSGQAAEVLRRFGFDNAWHIAGGLALGGGRHNDVSLDCADALPFAEMEYVI